MSSSFQPEDRASIPTALVARLEAASVGSRELDCLLYEALWPGHRRVPGQARRYFDPSVISPQGAIKYITRGTFVAPAYTTSLDAALALAERVLPGQEFEISTLYGAARVTLNINHGDGESPYYGSNDCGSVALAVVIAILKAIAAVETSTAEPTSSRPESAPSPASDGLPSALGVRVGDDPLLTAEGALQSIQMACDDQTWAHLQQSGTAERIAANIATLAGVEATTASAVGIREADEPQTPPLSDRTGVE